MVTYVVLTDLLMCFQNFKMLTINKGRFQFNIANENFTNSAAIKVRTYIEIVRVFTRLDERKALAYSKRYTAK